MTGFPVCFCSERRDHSDDREARGLGGGVCPGTAEFELRMVFETIREINAEAVANVC